MSAASRATATSRSRTEPPASPAIVERNGDLETIKNKTLATAGEIDELYATLRAGSAAPSLPKGLSPATFALVARTLREADGDLSAEEVAARTGVSRVTSRRYLDHLARSGLVEVAMRYGRTGRPEHRYGWMRAGDPQAR